MGRLPNFLIVGAAKSGTTSLYYNLKKHPQIYMPDNIKESYFLTGNDFSDINPVGGNYGENSITTIEEYELLFSDAIGCDVIGEVTTGYLYFYKETIPNIKKYLGSPKILIVLRNPVSRAYSNYLHHVRDGYENCSFEEAIRLQERRNRENYWWGYQFIKAGRYYLPVKAYMDEFDSVKVMLFDDLKKNPSGFYCEIMQFLNVDANYACFSSEKYNKTGVPKSFMLNSFLNKPSVMKGIIKNLVPSSLRKQMRNKISQYMLEKPEMNLDTKEYLINVFKDDIEKLSALIGRDLMHWLK